jgi:integrase
MATGENPASVMAQLGHTDPTFTLRVYTHMMRRGTSEREKLKALVNGEPIESGQLDSPDLGTQQ